MRLLRQNAQQNTWSYEDYETYEKIDKLNSEIMRHAERSITWKYSKKYPWSPALANAIEATRYWKLKLKWSRGLFVSDEELQKTGEKARLPADHEKITTRITIIEYL